MRLFVFMHQMQFLVSRLASQAIIVDFDEDGGNDMQPVDGCVISSQPAQCNGLKERQNYAEKLWRSNVPDGTSSAGPQLNFAEQSPACVTEQSLACIERFCHSAVPSVRHTEAYNQTSGPANMMSNKQQQDSVRDQRDYAEIDAQQLSCTAQQRDSSSTSVEQQTADCAKKLCHTRIPAVAEHHDSVDRLDSNRVGRQSDCAEVSRLKRQPDCARKSCSISVQSDSESTMSLNELLDGSLYDTDAGETYATDSGDVDACTQPSVSHRCEIVNMLHVSVGSDASIPPISDNTVPRVALNPQHGRHICNVAESTGVNESTSDGSNNAKQHNSQSVMSAPMQRSFVESNMSSSSSLSDKAHADEGYHSNVASAISQETAGCDESSSVSTVVQRQLAHEI